MKFTIDRSRFDKLLTTANIAIGSKSPTAAFLNYKLVIDDNGLTVTGSNGELTITTFCPVEENDKVLISNFEKGSTLISAKYLLDIVKNLDSAAITIEIVDTIARISNGKYQSKLNSMSAEEYPDLDLEKNGKTIVLPTEDFKTIVTQTAFAASTKEVRPVLTAINAKATGTTIEFIATDSYRLSKKTYSLDQEEEIVANIPVKIMNEVSKLVDGKEVEITFSANKIVFSYGTTNVYSRLVAGDFPKTTGMFPTNYPYVLQVNSSLFISAMQRVSLLAVERENIVKLCVSDEGCNISSKSEQIGSADENIEEYRYAGGRFEISFNVNYVIDAIKAVQSEDVVLSFVGEMSAFKVSSPVDDLIVEIVTPVRNYY